MQQQLRAAAWKTLARTGLGHWIYRYREWRTSRLGERPPATDPDGVPLPGAYLMQMIGGTTDWRFFLQNGEASARTFAGLVDRHGAPFRSVGRVLDFGCGCGRLLRHLPKLTDAELFGVDYNPRLVRWCARNLPGTFSRNALTPPLDFPDGHFEVVYLLSVFTHLRLATQNAWLAEFSRILKPGGIALVTFHDEDHGGVAVSGLDRDDLIREGFVVRNDQSEGSNMIAAFQTREFAARQFAEVFDVLEIVPGSQNPSAQAIGVLRKR